MLSTTQKGDVGLFVICADLVEKGYTVLLPSGGNPHYDVVIEKEGIYRRIQVKYSTEKDGVIKVRLFTVGRNGERNLHTAKNVDIFAIYEPLSKSIYYLNRGELNNRTMFTLRMRKAKSNRTVDTHMFSDFKELRL